jgi:Bacterial protein of unknown function (DUF922)
MPLDQISFSYPVSWSDFIQKSSRPAGETEDAQIHPEMGFSNFQLKAVGRGVGIKDVDININLVTNDCWVVTSQMTNGLLQHEQGHYDIIAISAREFYNVLLGLSAASTHALQTKVTELRTRFQQKATTVDKRYDTQTDHSRKTQQQQQWDKAIAAEKQKSNGSISNLP